MTETEHGYQYEVKEWQVSSSYHDVDSCHHLEVSAIFEHQQGRFTVPAFWAGGKNFKFRFRPIFPGLYSFHTVCNKTSSTGLSGLTGKLKVKPCRRKNNPFSHGLLCLSSNGRFLQWTDGKPFFWLGDTWWMGFCDRLSDSDFLSLVEDRKRKGFSVIQIVAGLYPDMPAFDPRGKNKAGFPWENSFERINPKYFDEAEKRLLAILKAGLVPCIVGAWGYYLPWMGIRKMKQHWCYLIARWSCYPVIWCLAGEGEMPYYLSNSREEDRSFQKKGWTEIAAYVKQIDPYQHPVTIHPCRSSRQSLEDISFLDVDMLQTGHGDRMSLATTVNSVLSSYQSQPVKPVIEGEVCYEGIGQACRQEVQRLMFWACWLSGAKGFTYGANGLWQVNTRLKPYGPSPHGMSWGETPWEEAYQLPGSTQLGLAKKLLENYPWWLIEPHPEWVQPHASAENYLAPYAGGIPGKLRLVYLPHSSGSFPLLKQLEPGLTYNGYLWNPVNGKKYPLGKIQSDSQRECKLSQRLPVYQDWLLVLESDTLK